MHTIWIFSLEPIETRYTSQWFEGVPKQLAAHAEYKGVPTRIHMDPGDFNKSCFAEHVLNIVNVPGSGGRQKASTGAFLNFASTNVWKNDQVNRFIGMIDAGLVRDGDKVWIADAWHTGVLQLAYIRDLLGLRIELSAFWHAGSYDPWDFLGRKISDKTWSYATERALFWAIDKNFFATQFHWDLFSKALGIDRDRLGSRAGLSGLPCDFLWDEIPQHCQPPSERPDLILFPHRLAPEKQLAIFKDLEAALPQYEWVVCQEQQPSKPEYHRLLGRAKMSFSAALQETLGIAQGEAIIAGAMALSPDRLSYSEQYDPHFLYPDDMTVNWDVYQVHKPELEERINSLMHDYTTLETQARIRWQEQKLKERFFTARPLYQHLVGA